MNPLLRHQLNALFQRSRFAILLQFIAALAVVGALFGKLPNISLAAWSAGIIAIYGLQLIMAQIFLTRPNVSRPMVWQGAAGMLSLVAGLLWGLLALIQPEVASLVQVGLVVATAAVAALVLWSTASSAGAFPGFMLGLLVPWGITMLQGPAPSSAVVLAPRR